MWGLTYALITGIGSIRSGVLDRYSVFFCSHFSTYGWGDVGFQSTLLRSHCQTQRLRLLHDENHRSCKHYCAVILAEHSRCGCARTTQGDRPEFRTMSDRNLCQERRASGEGRNALLGSKLFGQEFRTMSGRNLCQERRANSEEP